MPMATPPATGSDAAMAVAPPPPVIKSPMERYSEAVERNPLDFNSWVQLLALVETDPSVPQDKVEATFDKFLTEFPLCFGYWNKYAQYQLSLAGKPSATSSANASSSTATPATEPAIVDPAAAMKKAREIYERGVVAVRFSVHMWQKYIEFLLTTARVSIDEARAALEEAVAACANDPSAGPLWDQYIQLETIQNDMLRLNQIFKRVMAHPLTNLNDFWEKYNQFVLAQQLHVLATSEELAAMGAEEEMDEGLLRVKIVNHVEAIKNKTLEGIYKRRTFEAGIDRNYFHVTPVSDAALANWHAYLDYEEIAGDDATKCELLYERCLISCANYEALWVRYALWKERTQGFDAADSVFQRAVDAFLKYRASIYLEYAVFLEAHQKIASARAIYGQVLTEVAPQLVEAFIRVTNFERRQGQMDTAKSWYERGIDQLSSQLDAYSFLAISYATFASRILSDFALARDIYERATTKVTSSMVLWLQFIQFETAIAGEDRVARVSSVFNNALAGITALSDDEKNDLWLQFVDFMEVYASDVAELRAVQEQEVTWRRKNAMPRERSIKVLYLESSASSDGMAGEVGSKRPRYDAAAGVNRLTVSTPTVVAATSAAAAASYGQYYQQYQVYGAAQAVPAATATDQSAAAYAQYQQQYAAYYQQPAQQ